MNASSEQNATIVRELALGAVVLSAIVFAFTDPLRGMVDLWDNSPMYSYGYAIPLVSVYLLWAMRDRLWHLSPQPARVAGASVLALAMVMALASSVGGLQMAGQLGFLVAIVGAVMLIFGVGYLRVVWPAIAYLLLMVPVWDVVTEPLHWPFQNQSALLAMTMLRAVGVPVHRDGTLLALPGLTLEVARQCSGVNYLIAVLALGLPLSFLYLPTMGRRVALLLIGLTVAAFSNALRVTLIGILAYADIGSPLHGPFHILHGLFVSAIGYAALFAGLRVLGPKTGAPMKPRAQPNQPGHLWRLPRIEAALVVAMFVVLGAGPRAMESASVQLRGGLEQLSPRLLEWEWNRGAGLVTRTEWPGADAEIGRQYRLADGTTADIYVAYFAAQKQDKEIANSRADGLHRRATIVTLGHDGNAAFRANQVATDPTGAALFWYELDSVHTSSIGTRLQTLWNAVIRGRTNGAVVLVSTPSSFGGKAGSPEQLQALAHQLRQEVSGLLPKTTGTGGAGAP